MSSEQETEREDALREVERVMMYIAEAQRKAEEICEQLARRKADPKFTAALQTAASALRAEHNRLLNSTHFDVPDLPVPEPEAVDATDASEQQRMAI